MLDLDLLVVELSGERLRCGDGFASLLGEFVQIHGVSASGNGRVALVEGYGVGIVSGILPEVTHAHGNCDRVGCGLL